MVKIPSNDAKIMKQKLEIYTSDVDLMADLLKKYFISVIYLLFY